jgi:membrane protein YdbS with pleckstrin-like domain
MQHRRRKPESVNGAPLWRLYALRAGYLLLVVGLGSSIWPGIFHHDKPWGLMQGVVKCMLAALSLLAIVGLRYPLQMLPLLFFELAWKFIWLTVVALPLWSAHQMDADTLETTYECFIVVVYLIVIPWRYAFANYALKPGDRWR